MYELSNYHGYSFNFVCLSVRLFVSSSPPLVLLFPTNIVDKNKTFVLFTPKDESKHDFYISAFNLT